MPAAAETAGGEASTPSAPVMALMPGANTEAPAVAGAAAARPAAPASGLPLFAIALLATGCRVLPGLPRGRAALEARSRPGDSRWR